MYGERAEAKTLNPLFAMDSPSRTVAGRMSADLIHINRLTLKTEPALAKSYTVSRNGLHYELELRQGLKFSDGHPFDADDVMFTFQVVLDPKVNAPQRALWILDGKPTEVRKLSAHRVAFDFPRVNAVGERIFDGVAMLPRHLLEAAYREGSFEKAWGLRTAPSQIAGLGPFRLKEYTAGQQILLERNPNYWKTDASGNRLPYLAELAVTFAPGEDMQIMRFQAGESDAIARISPKNYTLLDRDNRRHGFAMQDAGASLEYCFLAFNLNDAARQRSWDRLAFRKAVSAAIDRDAIVRLVYQGFADPIASPVGAGNRQWINARLPKPVRSLEKARELLAADGFRWPADGLLRDPAGSPVRFSIVVSSSNPERLQIATLIQADLRPLGIEVNVVPLEFRSLIDRVERTREYDASILALNSTDADPNVDLNFWLTSGTQHIWRPRQPAPATVWEAEIDTLMRKQLITLRYDERKRLFDRVQELARENLPVLPLVSPHVLAGARTDLGNFRPALIEPHALWNVDELYWRDGAAGRRR